MNEKRFLTLLETAGYLSLKPSKIYEMSSRECLPGKVRFDGVVRVDRVVLDEWLAFQTHPSKGGAGA